MNRNETLTAPKVIDFGTSSDTHDKKTCDREIC